MQTTTYNISRVEIDIKYINGRYSSLPTSADFKIKRNPNDILQYFDDIRDLADSEKDSLGFMKEPALRESIARKKLVALVDMGENPPRLAGYIFHSGIYPHAKVQQIATVSDYRSMGVGAALLRNLISELESLGFITLRADIAEDLIDSLRFYQSNGFVHVKTRKGGKTRNRKILMHSRELETDTLFKSSQNGIDLGIRRRSANDSPFYALDLNVYFDLAKDRKFSELARRLFGAALSHYVRLTVADEFTKELEKTSADRSNDPILEMAFRLPRMPSPKQTELDELHLRIHKTVFEDTGNRDAHTPQALSDSKHLAHAALARASAFVTRDTAILDARNSLLSQYGIDAISTQELESALPLERPRLELVDQQGDGFKCISISKDKLENYLRAHNIAPEIMKEFTEASGQSMDRTIVGIQSGNDVLGVYALQSPRTTQPVCRLLIHVRTETLDAELYADHLLDTALKEASSNSPVVLELVCLNGQSLVTSFAKARGFYPISGSKDLYKVALGRPVTAGTWQKATGELRVRANLSLPANIPKSNTDLSFNISSASGQSIDCSLRELEDILNPALLVWPERSGVIASITKEYAGQLLRTDDQLPMEFIIDKDASFLSMRSYVNTPRAASLMRADTPILFYESSSSGGSGCIVAIARIVDSVVVKANDIPNKALKRLVVDNVNDFSSTSDVLLTSFDNVFRFPRPVSFQKLKALNAVSGANLVTSARISSRNLEAVLELGWTDE